MPIEDGDRVVTVVQRPVEAFGRLGEVLARERDGVLTFSERLELARQRVEQCGLHTGVHEALGMRRCAREDGLHPGDQLLVVGRPRRVEHRRAFVRHEGTDRRDVPEPVVQRAAGLLSAVRRRLLFAPALLVRDACGLGAFVVRRAGLALQFVGRVLPCRPASSRVQSAGPGLRPLI